jgi:hypothetical protein
MAKGLDAVLKASARKMIADNAGIGAAINSDANDDYADPDQREIHQADLATYSLLDKLKRDPAGIGFPAMLPVELALNTGKVSDTFESYGLTINDYHRLKTDPLFLEAIQSAKKMAGNQGWSFRMKALLQSEELLRSSWSMIHSADTPPNVKKDLIVATWRAAGVADPEQTESAKNNFNIVMNLG